MLHGVCVCMCRLIVYPPLSPQMLKEVVVKTLKHYGITSEHKCFKACSQRLFDVSKLYLKVYDGKKQSSSNTGWRLD